MQIQISGAAALFLALSLILTGCGGESDESAAAAGGGEPPPAPVTTEAVDRSTVAIEQVYAGRARGAREVEVRARVRGILEERLYVEGHSVEEGESLFQIDPEPFEVALARARAELSVAESNLRQAEREWRRISGLFEQDAISERERDSARSDLELARANLAVAESGVAQAQLNLDYTNVRAPLSGITSLEVLAEGSLISEGTLLTTIVQQDPVHVRFSLPEEDASLQRAARSAMRGQGEAPAREAVLMLPDGTRYEHTGSIDFTASTVDPRTGTVLARAVFPNPEGDVIPGQFVRVRVLLEELENVITVPESAIGAGGEGATVFVVGDDDRAHLRPVRLGPVVNNRRVIREGLESGDRVVISGQVGLRDGAPVAAKQSANGEAN